MMQCRFAVLGDLHLTSGPQNADRLHALDYVIGNADKERIDAWLWPGDLTHSGMTIEIRNALVERIQLMATIAPVVIVPGNHDPAGDLDFLEKIRAEYRISVVTSPQVVNIQLASGGEIALFCLPYPNKARIVAAGTPNDQIGAVAKQAFDAIFMEAGEQLARARRSGHLTGAIGHATIEGSVASTGQPQIGAELYIDATHLSRLGNCFQAFGHIHKHQHVASAVYAGSMCRLDWGEVEEKGYLEIACSEAGLDRASLDNVRHDQASQGKTWIHEVRFVPIPVPPMIHVEGVLTRDAFTWSGSKNTNDFSGCDVRVRASYAQQERDVLATARERIAREFSAARRLVIETIAVPDRGLRAPEVIAAQTLEDKLKAWARLSGVAWSEQVLRCANRLENSANPDAVVADVEQRLSPLADLASRDEALIG